MQIIFPSEAPLTLLRRGSLANAHIGIYLYRITCVTLPNLLLYQIPDQLIQGYRKLKTPQGPVIKRVKEKQTQILI